MKANDSTSDDMISVEDENEKHSVTDTVMHTKLLTFVCVTSN